MEAGVEGDGQRVDLHCGERQVGERHEDGGPTVSEVLPSQPEHRECAGRDGKRLQGDEHQRARPHPPERYEQEQHRLDMTGQLVELVAVTSGDLKEVAVKGVHSAWL